MNPAPEPTPRRSLLRPRLVIGLALLVLAMLFFWWASIQSRPSRDILQRREELAKRDSELSAELVERAVRMLPAPLPSSAASESSDPETDQERCDRLFREIWEKYPGPTNQPDSRVWITLSPASPEMLERGRELGSFYDLGIKVSPKAKAGLTPGTQRWRCYEWMGSELIRRGNDSDLDQILTMYEYFERHDPDRVSLAVLRKAWAEFLPHWESAAKFYIVVDLPLTNWLVSGCFQSALSQCRHPEIRELLKDVRTDLLAPPLQPDPRRYILIGLSMMRDREEWMSSRDYTRSGIIGSSVARYALSEMESLGKVLTRRTAMRELLDWHETILENSDKLSQLSDFADLARKNVAGVLRFHSITPSSEIEGFANLMASEQRSRAIASLLEVLRGTRPPNNPSPESCFYDPIFRGPFSIYISKKMSGLTVRRYIPPDGDRATWISPHSQLEYPCRVWFTPNDALLATLPLPHEPADK